MTPAQRAQVAYCRELIKEGQTAEDMRMVGFAEAAIRQAITEEKADRK